MDEHALIATAPAGVEPLLINELTALGAIAPCPVRGGAAFHGTLELAYRAPPAVFC